MNEGSRLDCRHNCRAATVTDTLSPEEREPVVAVIPFGSVPVFVSNVVAAHVSGYLDLAAVTLPPMKIPPETFCERRRQYDAAPLINAIEALPLTSYWKILAVFDVDLFLPLFTHVFGEARQNGRVGLISLFRLKTNTDGSVPPDERILERVGKIGLHELGHLLNLLHCDDDRCLMHFCGNVDKLDRIEINFCRYCRKAIRRTMIPFSSGTE